MTENATVESPDACAMDREYARLGWPSYLAKAAMDPFTYAMGLRTGAVLVFETARAITGSPEWVRILAISEQTGLVSPTSYPFSMDRGMDIRLSDIVWVADAPYGS